MNLEDLTSWWHESLVATHSPRTRKIYLEAVNRLLDGRTEVPGKRELLAYFGTFKTTVSAKTGRPLSPGYVNQHWRSLQQFYKFLAAEELIDKNPFDSLKQPVIPSRPVEVFSEEELTRLFTAATSRRDRAILRVMLDTGVRVGELAGMKLVDVDFAQKRIMVTGKASHARWVPISSKTYTDLRRYLIVRPGDSETLFVGDRSPHKPLTHWGIRLLLDRLAEKAEVQGMHPHRFRHTMAHLWLANGGLETDLRRLMGWNSPSMVYRYAASAGAERAHSAHARLAIADRF